MLKTESCHDEFCIFRFPFALFSTSNEFVDCWLYLRLRVFQTNGETGSIQWRDRFALSIYLGSDALLDHSRGSNKTEVQLRIAWRGPSLCSTKARDWPRCKVRPSREFQDGTSFEYSLHCLCSTIARLHSNWHMHRPGCLHIFDKHIKLYSRCSLFDCVFIPTSSRYGPFRRLGT